MDYRSELSAFHDCLEKWDLTSCEIGLWHALWDVAMICGSTDSLSVAGPTLVLRTGFQRKSIERARKRLSDLGIIRFQSRGGRKAALYDLISLVRHTDPSNVAQSTHRNVVRHTDPSNVAQATPQTTPQSTPQSTPQGGHLYTTTIRSSSNISGHTDPSNVAQATPQGTHRMEPFLTDTEMDELAGNLDAVLDASERIGIPQAASDIEKANLLLADYGPSWLLEAIRRAGNGQATARSWRYVEGILRKWRENGCMDGDVPQTDPADDEEADRRRREDARTLARLRGELPQ